MGNRVYFSTMLWENGRMDGCPHRGADWRHHHVWRAARSEALRRSPTCGICRGTDRLEVHHRDWLPDIAPYNTGCWNHQENLEVLCQAHHRLEHAERRARRAGEPYQLPLVA